MFYSSSISSSRILNWSISFCRCMLSSKHRIVIILNLSNFIFPQFWPEIVNFEFSNFKQRENLKNIVHTWFDYVCMTKLQWHKLFPPIKQSQMLLKMHSNFLHGDRHPDCQFINFNSSEYEFLIKYWYVLSNLTWYFTRKVTKVSTQLCTT